MENPQQSEVFRHPLKGVLKGIFSPNSDISILAIEISWECNQLNRDEVRKDIEEQLQQAMPGLPAEPKTALLAAIEKKILHHKESKVMEVPLPPEVARKYGEMIGREVEIPFSMVPVDVENFDRTKEDNAKHREHHTRTPAHA